MAVREVLRLGHPLLRKVSKPVDPARIPTPQFQEFLDDMLETMHAYEGIGLAAPQVGVLERVALVAVPGNSSRYPESEEYELDFYINPEWEVLDESKIGIWEGCLSVPGLRGYVDRASHLRLKYLDREGKAHEKEVKGFPAIVFQHEFDHLDGVLFVDRIQDKEKFAFIEEYEAHWLEMDDE